MLKVGLGYDLHRLETGGRLLIGGVEIPSPYGAVAHSDGDVLIHAILDALITVATGENIGRLFPDTEKTYKDISSLKLLRRAREKFPVSLRIINIDAVVILDEPKINPHISRMREEIAEALGIHPEQIGIKGKTSEGTRSMSTECHAVALLEL